MRNQLLGLAFAMCAAGCSSGSLAGSFGSGGVGDATSPTGATVDGSQNQMVPSGVLTAGMWDDNLNYDFFRSYQASKAALFGAPGFAVADYDAAHAALAQRSRHAVVDAAVVIDTTGSMGDEIAYLTAEFSNIAGAISSAFPGADQRWALVTYRDTPEYDHGDDYVVRSVDFSGSAAAFTSLLGQQSASGGGDFPESPELGLAALPQLTWRGGDTVAKLAFWVGDAPQHAQNSPAMKQAITDVRAAGIHVYPVSASGTDELLEFTMRAAAQLTGGRYMFLTDDSGIGDTHKTPEIPCYYVTKLQQAIVRAVSAELTGVTPALDPAQIIRTVGNPSASGQCVSADNQTVQIY